MRFSTQEFYLKSRAEMAKLFDGDEGPRNRTWEIAQMCDIELEPIGSPFPAVRGARRAHDRHLLRVRPRAKASKTAAPIWNCSNRTAGCGALGRNTRKGWTSRSRSSSRCRYSGYFLIVWDFIRYAKSKRIPVGPGRGSAAGSLVAYAMEITDIDPLQYGLLFERFLNPERVSMPDVDIDFCIEPPAAT